MVDPIVRKRMQSQAVRDTKPEIEIALACHSLGLRYRKQVKFSDIRTTADLVFKKYNLIVFIDGCFWHGCPKHFRKPKTNTSWWVEKIDRNISRDNRKRAKLRKRGWSVMRIWEHTDPEIAAARIKKFTQRRTSRINVIDTPLLITYITEGKAGADLSSASAPSKERIINDVRDTVCDTSGMVGQI